MRAVAHSNTKKQKKFTKLFTTRMRKGGQVQVEEIKINKVKLGENSRRDVSDEEIAGLMSSIKQSGLLQPIGVVKKSDGFEIVYGNRRFLAASKLGHTTIPAVVHDSDKNDIIFKNLAENIQRRNISLPEAGRYFFFLSKDGMGRDEIAVRLGVPVNFVKSCLLAFNDVPEEFQDDIVQQTSTSPVPAGKIALRTAQAIISAVKTARLNKAQSSKLFRAAKKGDDFRYENATKYAMALKRGNEAFIEDVEPIKKMHVRFLITEKEHEKLTEKYVTDGPFQSLHGLFTAILSGEKAQKINILKNSGA